MYSLSVFVHVQQSMFYRNWFVLVIGSFSGLQSVHSFFFVFFHIDEGPDKVCVIQPHTSTKRCIMEFSMYCRMRELRNVRIFLLPSPAPSEELHASYSTPVPSSPDPSPAVRNQPCSERE